MWKILYNAISGFLNIYTYTVYIVQIIQYYELKMFHHEIFTFSSALRDLLDLIPLLPKLSAHNTQ